MQAPKKRKSKMRRDMRRSHDARVPSTSIVCSNCGGAVLRHRMCPSCGFYRGKQVLGTALHSRLSEASSKA